MSIESEVFKKYIPNNKKLIKYGFKECDKEYKLSKTFMNNTFRADIVIDNLYLNKLTELQG